MFTSGNLWPQIDVTGKRGFYVHERTRQLRQLMAAHRLNARDVAQMIDRSETTVRIWRCKHAARVIPAQTLRLLQLEVQAQAVTA